MKLDFLICDGFIEGIFFLRVDLRELRGEFNEVLALSKTVCLFFLGGLGRLKEGLKSKEVPRIIYNKNRYKAIVIKDINVSSEVVQ